MLTNKKFLAFLVFILLILIALVVLLVPDYFFGQGMKYYKKGNYPEAYKYFYKAKLLVPSNNDYRYYYVQTLTKFKPSARIQKEMFDFVEHNQKDSAGVAASIQVALWKNNINQVYGDNYIYQAPLNSDVIRWNSKTFPLKVYIDLQDVTKVPEYYNTEIVRAFGQWKTTSGFLSFKFVNSPKNADISIKFAPLPKNNCTENGCKYIVAHTIPDISNKLLKNMTITLYDRDANGNFFSDKELFNTILHEIGHALGIMGHSYSTDDLMYMGKEGTSAVFTKHRSDFQYISYKDVNTLKLLYNLAPTITNTPLSEIDDTNLIYPPIIFGTSKNMSTQKLKEAENYIKEAPNVPNGYIDMAAAYDELGNFEKAQEALKNAFNVSVDPTDKFIVMFNFAVLYLNNDQPETALSYAKQAQKFGTSEDLADLMSNINHAIQTKSSPFKGIRLLK